MEVIASGPKHLQRHIVPILVLATGLLLISITSYNFYARTGASTSLKHALTAHFLSIRPASNGLAKISVVRDSGPSHQSPSPAQSNLGALGATSGGTAQLDMNE
jgi:type IV secretory pathway VirB6-like protein